MSQPTPGRFTQLVEAAKRGRLVLYLGAGISMGEPSCGPTGWKVADVLRPYVAQMLEVEEEDLAGLSLEALAERVAEEDGDRLEELRVRASEAADFLGIAPNFGHEAAALLLREGAIKLISVNWDCGIEAAGLGVGIGIKGVARSQESIEIGHGLAVFKVHGCVTRPPTLAITQSDVDEPQGWAVGKVQGALSDGIVAFVGLGTVGLYVREPIEDLVEVWGQEASVLVADPVLSAAWVNALGGAEQAARSHIQCKADCFLDGLLRGLVLEALVMSEQQIRALPQEEGWVTTMLEGFLELRKALGQASADGLIRWWRDGVNRSVNGKPFITEQGGGWSMMTVGLLAGEDGGEIEVSGSPGRQTVASGKRYFEIVSRPAQPISEVERVGRDRIQRRYADGIYVDRKPVSAVVAGATGRFPSREAPADISAGAAEMSDVAEGVEAIPIRFFAAEDGVRGRLAA
jgi:hypothetical protein